MAMAGVREVLVYSENEGKIISVTAGILQITGKVLRVNPLILEPTDGGPVTVLDFDAIQGVAVHDTTGEDVVKACKPQTESKFSGTRRF